MFTPATVHFARNGEPACGASSQEKAGFRNSQTSVTAVTDRPPVMRDTSIVNMVQRVSKKTLLEPGDTRQQWKGEAATSFVLTGITSSRALPTSSVGYWSPILYLFSYKASEETLSFGGIFLPGNRSMNNHPAPPEHERSLNEESFRRPPTLSCSRPYHSASALAICH